METMLEIITSGPAQGPVEINADYNSGSSCSSEFQELTVSMGFIAVDV